MEIKKVDSRLEKQAGMTEEMNIIADQINENQRLNEFDAMFRQSNVSPILTQDSILGNVESLQFSVGTNNCDL